MSKVVFELEFEWEGVDTALYHLEQELESAIRGMSVELWEKILDRTPQYSGALAASWTYSLNSAKFIDRSDKVDMSANALMRTYEIVDGKRVYGEEEFFAPFERGAPQAVGIANDNSAGAAQEFRLGDTIYIANGVSNDESGNYSSKVENEEFKLRAVNRPGNAMSRSVDEIIRRYGDMSQVSAERLRTKTL